VPVRVINVILLLKLGCWWRCSWFSFLFVLAVPTRSNPEILLDPLQVHNAANDLLVSGSETQSLNQEKDSMAHGTNQCIGVWCSLEVNRAEGTALEIPAT